MAGAAIPLRREGRGLRWEEGELAGILWASGVHLLGHLFSPKDEMEEQELLPEATVWVGGRAAGRSAL